MQNLCSTALLSGSSNEIMKYNYKGKTYYFSHDTWLDSIFITVPDEIGIELAYEFNRGKKRYHYKNQKEIIYYYHLIKILEKYLLFV